MGAHQRTHREGRRLIVVKGQDTPIDQILHVAKLGETLETTTADPAELSPNTTT